MNLWFIQPCIQLAKSKYSIHMRASFLTCNTSWDISYARISLACKCVCVLWTHTHAHAHLFLHKYELLLHYTNIENKLRSVLFFFFIVSILPDIWSAMVTNVCTWFVIFGLFPCPLCLLCVLCVFLIHTIFSSVTIFFVLPFRTISLTMLQSLWRCFFR